MVSAAGRLCGWDRRDRAAQKKELERIKAEISKVEQKLAHRASRKSSAEHFGTHIDALELGRSNLGTLELSHGSNTSLLAAH